MPAFRQKTKGEKHLPLFFKDPLDDIEHAPVREGLFLFKKITDLSQQSLLF